MDSMSAAPAEAPVSETSAGRCPVEHLLPSSAGVCPFPHDGAAPSAPVHRSRPDRVMRTILRVKERPEGVTTAAAYSAFQKSMLISATRCTLTYVIFPFVLPMIGIATRVGPLLGITIGTFAIVCDVFAIRRFFTVDHKWRWYFTLVAGSVITLLGILLVQDISHLVT